MVDEGGRQCGVIAESLAGKRIAITGSTGFVGTALVERLLRCVPGCELVLLIRSGKRTSAADRLKREILKNDAFDRLREELGGAKPFEEMAARRIQVLEGDVSIDGLGLSEADRAVLATCDIVIHSGTSRILGSRRLRAQPQEMAGEGLI